MPLPQPKVPLQDHCSIIYNGKLYVYQSDAFQALDLQEGGQWTQLPMGVSTTGSACVRGSMDGQAAIIVVGGSTQQEGYNGLQHYTFESNSWKSDKPADGVATNRQRHGAAFLERTSEVLTYGGSQENDPTASSQTFVLSTRSPYRTQAFSSTAPPVSDPLILSFNTTHALMLGGDPTNKNLYTFSPDDGWHQLGVSLPEGIGDSSQVRATIINGRDGSKVLEMFDLYTTPNQITTLLLQNATSTSDRKKTRSYVSSPHHPAKRRKRDVPFADRPAYNSTLAPQDSRTGFSLASDPKTGLVVATGGNSQMPLAIFNETGNQWVDPYQFFGTEPTLNAPPPSSPSSPSSSSSSSSPSYSSSSSLSSASSNSSTAAPPAAAEANDGARDRSLTILGGTLGGVFGAAVLLVILLFLLRRCRKHRQRKEQEMENNRSWKEREEMDFRDVGVDFMKEAGGSKAGSTCGRDRSNHSAKGRDRSGATTSQSNRALLHAKGDSAGSGHSVWSRGTKSPENRSPLQISAPIKGPTISRSIMASPEPRPADAGWSRYFANNNTQEAVSKSIPPTENQRPETYMSNAPSQSDYGSSRIPSSHPHESAEVEPLNFRPSQIDNPPTTGSFPPADFSSPQLGLGVALTHGFAREPPAGSPTPSVVSDIEEEDEYRHSNGQDSWTPVESGGERDSRWTDDRPVSNYANSPVYPHPGERVRIPNFPMPSAGNSATTSPVSPHPQNEQNKGLRNVVSRDLLRTHSQRQRATDVVRTGTQRVTPSTTPAVGPFPRPTERPAYRGRAKIGTEDMSWLNLGTTGSEQHQQRQQQQEQQEGNLYFPG